MGDPTIGIRRLQKVLENTTAFPKGEVTEVQQRIQERFGDQFERIGASDLKTLRDDVYGPASKPAPGQVRLLDLLIGCLDPSLAARTPAHDETKVDLAGKEVASAGGVAEMATESSAPEKGLSARAKAETLLHSLKTTSDEAASATKRRVSKVLALPPEDYAKPARVVPFKPQQENNFLLMRVPAVYESYVFGADGKTLTCTAHRTRNYSFDVTTGDAETTDLAAVGSNPGLLEDDNKRLSEGGNYVYSVSVNRLYLWDANTGERVTFGKSAAEGLDYVAAPNTIAGRCSWLSADASRFQYVEGDNISSASIYELDLRTGQETELALPAHSAHREFSSDGAVFFCQSGPGNAFENRVHVFVHTEGKFTELKLTGAEFPLSQRGLSDVGLSENGAFAATAVRDDGVYVWNTATGERRGPVKIKEVNNPGSGAITNDGRVLAMYLHGEQAVQLYDVETGEALGEPVRVPGQNPTLNLQFSPDGKRLVLPGPRPVVMTFGGQDEDE